MMTGGEVFRNFLTRNVKCTQSVTRMSHIASAEHQSHERSRDRHSLT